MEALIRLASEDEDIRRITSAAMENSSVQGVVLDFDPLWLSAWNYSKRLGEDAFEQAVWNYRNRHRVRHEDVWPVLLIDDDLIDFPENEFPFLPLDLGWRPRFWDDKQGFPPVRITICLLPGGVEAPRFESRRYRILYETRPAAMLSSSPKGLRRPVIGGLSTGVGSTDCGTLGGILRDQNDSGRKYGMTCAHVMTNGTVDQPAQVDSRWAAPIGKVGNHVALQLPTGICTPASTTGLNTVDAALIEIDRSIAADLEVLGIGPLTGITPIAQIGQGQKVEFTGRSSGNTQLKIGALGAIYKLKANGQSYCFKNVIQLNWSRFYQLLAGRPVARGDSGAWICNHDQNGFGWCGMIIGDDRLHGYAIYAETIEAWWKQQGFSLSVI